MTAPQRLEAAGLHLLTERPELPAVEKCLRALVDALNGAGPLETEMVRQGAVARLQALNVGEARRIVTAAFAERPDVQEPPLPADAGQGTALTLEDPEPWPSPVDGATVLDELKATLARFVALGTGDDVILCLYVVHAHAHAAAQVSPIMGVTSPEKECGKTTLLTLLLALTPRALLASNISTSGVFRTVEKYRPTLLVDEADTFLRDNEELRGILNSGHFRAGAHIVRNVGDDFEPRTFSTWCPKAIALIGELPDTLTSRSIVVRMRRCTPHEAATLEGLRLDRLGELEPLRRRIYRWAQDNLDFLKVADPELPTGVRGRTADNWRPLLAIADRAGGQWPELARNAIVTMMVTDAEQAPATLLLADLREQFRKRGADRLPSAEVVDALGKQEDRPWPEWKGGRAITARQVARLLKRYDIVPRLLRDGANVYRGYLVTDFADAFSRYLPPDPLQTLQASNGAEERACDDPLRAGGVTDRASAKNPHGSLFVADVTDGAGGHGDAWEGGES